MLHASDQGACAAGTTRLARLWRLKAVDDLAQAQRQGATPHPLRPGKKVGVPQAIAGYMLAQ
jgi:hypothetical protein